MWSHEQKAKIIIMFTRTLNPLKLQNFIRLNQLPVFRASFDCTGCQKIIKNP